VFHKFGLVLGHRGQVARCLAGHGLSRSYEERPVDLAWNLRSGGNGLAGCGRMDQQQGSDDHHNTRGERSENGLHWVGTPLASWLHSSLAVRLSTAPDAD
jgi:hypothetical protein